MLYFSRFMRSFAALVFAAAFMNCSDGKSSRRQKPAIAQEFSLSSDEEAISFLAFGDSGTGEYNQYAVAEQMEKTCAKAGCDFAIIMGDNIYESGVSNVNDPQFQDKFEKPYKNLNFPIYLVLGNHDYRGNIQAQIDYTQKSSKWRMPARYYRVDLDKDLSKKSHDLSLLGIDTTTYSSEEAQRKWLRDELADDKGFRIVFGHHPIFSYGEHGDTDALKTTLMPDLCGKADIYFAGHEHDLQVLSSDCNTDLIISGAAGKLRDSHEGERTQFSRSTLGFVYVRLSSKEMSMHFIDEIGTQVFQKTYTR